MKKYVDGEYIEMTEAEIEALPPVETISYDDRVANRIRELYSVNDELALLRQRDTKPSEFELYNALVEQIKAEER